MKRRTVKRRFCAITVLAFALAGCNQQQKTAQTTVVQPQKAAVAPLKLRFRDVTAVSGLDFRQNNGARGKYNFLETTGSGVCWFDYDNDGWMDFYLVQNGVLPGSSGFGQGGNRLYRNNRNGKFSDVTKQAGVAGKGYGQGVCAADVDNDGWVDLLVTCYGRNLLYRNNGDGTFADVSAKARLGASKGWSTSAAFADYDNDGWVDLYVGHYCHYKVGEDPRCAIGAGVYSYCPPTQFKGESGRLYRNNRDGTFSDVTKAAGVEQVAGKNLGVVWGDFNSDGKIDFFVANDGRANSLFENKGDGTFTDVAFLAGVALSENGRAMAGMGTDMADYDNDGSPDIVAANYSDLPNELWRNEGKGLFTDVTVASRIGPPSMPFVGFGATFADVDLDGWKDIIVSNGHVADNIAAARKDLSFAQPALLYQNAANGTFNDASRAAGADFVKPRVGRGLAVADYDNDGDLDMLMTPLNGPAALLRNEGGNRNHWLGVRCVGSKDNRDGIGARVSITIGQTRQFAEVRSASGYLSQNDPRLTFGLGAASRIDRVEVQWPNGQRSEKLNVSADQVLKIVQEK